MLRRVVVVCGYGCNLDSPLKPYLDKVVRYLKETGIREVVFCGGYTQRRSSRKSEAGVMANYVEQQMPDVIAMWETGSYTTYDNIKAAAELIQRTHTDEHGFLKITIFCEATRALKVALLARHFMWFPPATGGKDIRIETDSWELMHPLKELVATLKDALAIRFSFLNTLQRRQRIRKSRTR